jgi:chlorite dismutase
MNELYRYLTIAVSNEWRRLDDRQREEDKTEFASAVRSTSVAVHAYSLVGTRADADLLLWIVADELDARRASGRRARAHTGISLRDVRRRTSETTSTPAARTSGQWGRSAIFRTSSSTR